MGWGGCWWGDGCGGRGGKKGVLGMMWCALVVVCFGEGGGGGRVMSVPFLVLFCFFFLGGGEG